MKSGDRLIVLGYTKINDSAIVLHALTQGRGRRSFIVSAGKNLSLLQPLSIVEAEISENPKSSLARASRFYALRPLVSLRTDPRKNAMALFMGEVLYRSVKDGMGDEDMFAWCEKSIATLEELESDFANYHLLFLLGLASQMGFAPSLEDIAPFAGERLRDAGAMLSLPFADALIYPLSGDRRSELCDIFLRYLAHHSESALDIRSLAVFKELFR